MQNMLSMMRSCIDDYQMIRPGDKIAVGVSGGKDSLALLRLLAELRQFYPAPFEIHAITLHMGYEEMDFSEVSNLCQELNIPYTIRQTDIKSIIFDIRKEPNPCALCAKMRRGALNDEAKKLGCNKVALGHHFDDAIETFFLSLVYEGRVSCFLPVTYLDRMDLTVIRPMLYLHEKTVQNFVRRQNLPVVHNPCPADKNTKREDIKALLYELEGRYPKLKQHIFGGLQRSPLPGWKTMPRHARDKQVKDWQAVEEDAMVHGWDFSPVEGHVIDAPLPWDYMAQAKKLLRPEMRLLDLDTGGGERLMELEHPMENVWCTENYAPNVALSKERLEPLGAHVFEAPNEHALPFEDAQFDIVLCRHGTYDPKEVFRVLKPGGLFLTQQVGEHNNREFVQFLLPDAPAPYPGWNLDNCGEALEDAGFAVCDRREAILPTRITDVPALIWFAKVLPWEFQNFSVEACAEQLRAAEKLVQERGGLQGSYHRFLLLGRKEA